MSEAGDYDPGPWKGHDFRSARRAYDVHAGRSYDNARTSGVSATKCAPTSLKTDSSVPVVILVDVTGSMDEWPATIFSKLPYLDLEGKEYLGKDMEICFAAVGDAHSDKYPLQVQRFAKGTDMKKCLEALIIEGNGGGGARESYELGALYFARNVKMPNATKPILIYICDEGIYDFVDSSQAKTWAKTDISQRMSSKEAFEELKSKYSCYAIRKSYGSSSGDRRSEEDREIQEQWEEYFGADRVCDLPEAGRVVDVIFGIFARETNRVDYFIGELTGRQTPEQVKTVMKSLESIHKLPAASRKKLPSGASVTRRKGCSSESKSLL
ncbi:hypothetical protein HY486_01780 [Candidatus Woesearchaeota archaeon]|nr:hypothetical protein [Candidatus Woesearchaeota archaeon]